MHVLFSHFNFFDTILDQHVEPRQWAYHFRGVKAYMRNTYVDYPVQNNLFMLPETDMIRSIQGIIDIAVHHNMTRPANFHEWLVNNFGQGLADTFLLPYNYKVS